MYSRPITIYQGIDNPIQVVIKNQDQKSVNLSGYAVQAEIQDPNHNVTVSSYAVTWANIARGEGTFTISKNTASALEQRYYKLTFKTIKVVDNTENPLYVDDNYGAPIDLRVLPAYYSTSVSVPFTGNTIIDGGTL